MAQRNNFMNHESERDQCWDLDTSDEVRQQPFLISGRVGNYLGSTATPATPSYPDIPPPEPTVHFPDISPLTAANPSPVPALASPEPEFSISARESEPMATGFPHLPAEADASPIPLFDPKQFLFSSRFSDRIQEMNIELEQKIRMRFINLPPGKVLDVSLLSFDGTGMRTVNPPTDKSSRIMIPDLRIISNNLETYAIAVKAVDADLLFINLFLIEVIRPRFS